MTVIFPPCSPVPEDSITPTEAIGLLAGAQSDDPFDPQAYQVSADEIDAANVRLFDALIRKNVTGVVSLRDGSCRRVPADWVRCFRSLVKINLGDGWRVEFRIARLPDTIEKRGVRRVSDEVVERPWFISRAAIEPLCARPIPLNRLGRRPTYPWEQFESEAARHLDEEGDYNEGWRQADLEKRMADWCTRSWEGTPSESLVREHCKRARESFLKQRADI